MPSRRAAAAPLPYASLSLRLCPPTVFHTRHLQPTVHPHLTLSCAPHTTHLSLLPNPLPQRLSLQLPLLALLPATPAEPFPHEAVLCVGPGDASFELWLALRGQRRLTVAFYEARADVERRYCRAKGYCWLLEQLGAAVAFEVDAARLHLGGAAPGCTPGCPPGCTPGCTRVLWNFPRGYTQVPGRHEEDFGLLLSAFIARRGGTARLGCTPGRRRIRRSLSNACAACAARKTVYVFRCYVECLAFVGRRRLSRERNAAQTRVAHRSHRRLSLSPLFPLHVQPATPQRGCVP